MFHRLQKIYHAVKAEFEQGAVNITGASAEAIENFNFMSLLADKAGMAIISKAHRLTYLEARVVEQAFIALIAQAYKLGCCIEQSAVVFIKLLEHGITESIELIEVKGTPLKVGFERVINGKLRPHYYDTHHFTMTNRDSRSDLNNLSTLKNIGVADTWGSGFLRQYGSTIPKATDFTGGFFSLEKMSSYFRVERNLEKAEWNNIADTLKELQKYINENFIPLSAQYKRPAADLDNELKKINEVFDHKVKVYKIFRHDFLIRPWLGMIDTVFQPAPQVSSVIQTKIRSEIRNSVRVKRSI